MAHTPVVSVLPDPVQKQKFELRLIPRNPMINFDVASEKKESLKQTNANKHTMHTSSELGSEIMRR